MVAGFASVLGKQARGAVLLEAAQQAKYLTPLQTDQFTRVGNTKTTRLNPQQYLKPAELLLAHRHHRHGASSGTPEPAGVSPLLCTGVSSLYCSYRCRTSIAHYGAIAEGGTVEQDAHDWPNDRSLDRLRRNSLGRDDNPNPDVWPDPH